MKLPSLCLACLTVAGIAASAASVAAATPQFQLSDSRYQLIPIVRASARARAPHIRDAIGNSTNWSGYAAETNLNDPTLGAITAITGTWTVPATTGGSTPRSPAYSSAWVGIDGFEDSQLSALFSGYSAEQQRQLILETETVEQIGTEQDWTGKVSSYYAWFEFYPNYAYEIGGFTVQPGDSVTGSVTYLGQNRWATTLTNAKRKETVTITATFAADRYSAEWIMEAPSSTAGVLPLADFGSVSFNGCMATINGKTVPIAATAWETLNMVNASDTALRAATTSLSGTGSGFVVTWHSD